MVIYVGVQTLEHLKQGGRISPAAAALANILNIKPVLKFDVGTLDIFKKCRGFAKVRHSMIEAMNTAMESMEIGELVTLALETMVVSLCMKVMSVLITVILFGRMIEIYLYTSIAPIPFATMSNREWGAGRNKLFPGASGTRISGIFYDGVCRHLCGACIHYPDFRQYAFSIVWSGGIYGHSLL